jgi:hypothetical protein
MKFTVFPERRIILAQRENARTKVHLSREIVLSCRNDLHEVNGGTQACIVYSAATDGGVGD